MRSTFAVGAVGELGSLHDVMRLARETITVNTDRPDEVRIFERWLRRWREDLTRFSENKSCGGCMETHDVEGHMEAIRAIPQQLRTFSEWSNPTPVGRGRRRRI